MLIIKNGVSYMKNNNTQEDAFKLLMSARVLFRGIKRFDLDTRRKHLKHYGIWLYSRLKRPLTRDDFRVKGRITEQTIYIYFDTLNTFYRACGSPINKRKANLSDDELKKFISGNKKIEKNGCWGSNHFNSALESGRLSTTFRGKTTLLYKTVYELFKGPVGEKCILHSCDNPSCFNPEHLSLGDHSENAKQSLERGRWATGKKSRPKNKIRDPYDYEALLSFVQQNCDISKKDEYLYRGKLQNHGYVTIGIAGKSFLIHRLLLANKLGKTYNEIEIARHVLPDGSEPQKHDLNPNHILEGSRTDNMYDQIKHSKLFKLSVDDVKKVKKDMKKQNFTLPGSKTAFDKKWADNLGVKFQTISDIRRNHRWRHINA
jgi:HNH endonuclease